MPEGDTIFRAARTLHRALQGKIVTKFVSDYPHLTRIDFDSPLAGRTITDVQALGKHLLMNFSGDLVLRTHMRMNGSWHIYRPGERWQRSAQDARIVLHTDDFVAVGFNVPVASFHTSAELARDPVVRRLGPDLLANDFDEEEALRRFLAEPQLEIAEALLRQSVMAGAGNVFKSEILFICGISPFAPVAAVPVEQLRAVIIKARQLLGQNVIDGKGDGIVTYHGFRRTTGRADATSRLWVYGRGGQPCRRCAARVQFRRQGIHARVTYFCPQCQASVA